MPHPGAVTGLSDQPPRAMRAEARRVYGEDPLGYEAGRPAYPARVDEVLTTRCGLGPGTDALEVGPGTGRATRALLARGARVVAVEPDPTLAAKLPGLVGAEGRPELQVVAAGFEEAELPEGAFDLAAAATSFHWVDQAVGLPKLGRLLRPGGWAALWWTVFGDHTRPDPFHDATCGLLGVPPRPVGSPPAFELDEDARRADLAGLAGLGDVRCDMVRWSSGRLGPDGVRAMYASLITVRRRPPAEREQVLDALVEVAKGEFGGVVERPFVTAIYTGRRP